MAAPKHHYCSVKRLPNDRQYDAAIKAITINPLNRAPMAASALLGLKEERAHLSVLTTKWWHSGGVQLTVGFMEKQEKEFIDKIIAYANLWNARANVKFTYEPETSKAKIRVSTRGDGYWSYLGTDILSIKPNEPTLNLEGFTLDTPESEYMRVVPHEFFHSCGAPHEHQRRDVVARIDEQKAIDYFRDTQGWTPDEVRQQVLTPLEESSLIGTPASDTMSIMCYFLPGTITKDGEDIEGGSKIDEIDFQFAAKIYPKPLGH